MKKEHLFILAGVLIVAIIFSVVQWVMATTPNPGHAWSEIDTDAGATSTFSGDISATSNYLSNCAWQSYTCAEKQVCPQGQIVAGVDRDANQDSGLCGPDPANWYYMRLYCCDI